MDTKHPNSPHSIKPVAFASAVSKAKWADQHILNMEKAFRAMQEASSRAFSAENDPEGDGVVKLSFDYAPAIQSLATLRMLAGDAIHNLRSALDHLAYGIVGTFREPSPTLYFPIDVDRSSLMGKRSFREIQAVAPDIADVIVNDVKPYGTSNAFVGLNQLDRMDKHRLLLVHTMRGEAHIYAAKDDGDAIPESAKNSFILITNPTRVPRAGSVAAAHNEQYAQAAFDVQFDKGLPFQNEPVIPTLHQLAEVVAKTIQILATHCFGKGSPP